MCVFLTLVRKEEGRVLVAVWGEVWLNLGGGGDADVVGDRLGRRQLVSRDHDDLRSQRAKREKTKPQNKETSEFVFRMVLARWTRTDTAARKGAGGRGGVGGRCVCGGRTLFMAWWHRSMDSLTPKRGGSRRPRQQQKSMARSSSAPSVSMYARRSSASERSLRRKGADYSVRGFEEFSSTEGRGMHGRGGGRG